MLITVSRPFVLTVKTNMLWRCVCCDRGPTRGTYELENVSSKMPLVQIKQGVLEGVEQVHENGKYFAFKGIPYAKPPLGSLRFKAPEPPEPWQGIRDASQHGPVCPQYNERMGCIETGNEDCLYLNVYSKNLTPTKPLPVLVWIHGGGFYTGSGNSDFYGPEFFMEQDVVLVTFNYRLEALGFLCLDNEDVPGNAGLKDQVAALKWVKQNITAFGGDNNNITIFGCSAGAGSVSLHLLSEMSEGLFHKAICQSGTCLNDWVYSLYPKERAFQLGKHLGKDTEDVNELLEFLRSVPVSSLVNVQLPFLNTAHLDITDSFTFSPVIEKSKLRVEKIIEEPPIDLVRKGRIANVPIIVGLTSGEGIEVARKLPYILQLLSLVGGLVPRELKYKWTPEQIQDADNKIRKYYFSGKEITKDMLQEVSNFETDALFAYDIVRFARYHNHHTSEKTYLYKFIAETERNFTKKSYKMDSVDGVCHADDLPYLFNVTCLDIPLTDESKHIVKQMVRLWCNFASTGNPTSSNETEQWKPFSDTERNCFIIGKGLKCVQNQDAENIHFWEGIYGEERIGGSKTERNGAV